MDNGRKFQVFKQKMLEEGIPDLTIETFKKYYQQLCDGMTGIICEAEIEPPEEISHSNSLKDYQISGESKLSETVVIKLNGGLGTSMGMSRAKSLVKVKNGLSFLDIIARQILELRTEYNADVPLLLMNSSNTRMDSLEALKKYTDLPVNGLPLDFLQNRVPKIVQSDLSPAYYRANPSLEWNPPGHGDIYNALVISGCLDQLLEKGIKYAFISNSDNLGAELDLSILGYFAEHEFSFMMEVAKRTLADRKGGHLAKHKDGHLLLREIAQCRDSEQKYFQDINRYKYFNTNSIWVNLQILDRILKENNNFIELPLIRNAKTVNPQDSESTAVYQLETAMGAAIARFNNATAICVPRSRFLPVKTTNDLIGLWSDAYILIDGCHVRLHPDRTKNLLTELDNRYYKMINQLEERFPEGAPGLLKCNHWSISGDIVFGKNIKLEGTVHITNDSESQRVIQDNSIIKKDLNLADEQV